jgi:TolB-like protein/class 3 adenylate cyclase/Flp pilus assembly protein TadD
VDAALQARHQGRRQDPKPARPEFGQQLDRGAPALDLLVSRDVSAHRTRIGICGPAGKPPGKAAEVAHARRGTATAGQGLPRRRSREWETMRRRGKAGNRSPAPRRCAPDIFLRLLYHGLGAGSGPPPGERFMERRLAAILAADVVGYTRLMGVDEAGTLARLKALRAEVIDPEIAEHNGRLVKLMGDGALVEFASVVDAVACAVAIQREMAAHSAEVPEDRRITFRIGINLGDVIVEGDDIYGDGVNIAARLEGLAEPGGICISDIVHQSVKAKLDLGFQDLGAQQVKNVAEPVRIYRVRLDPEAVGKPLETVEPAKARRPRRALAAGLATLVALAGVLLWQRPWAPDVEPARPERMAFPLPEKPSIAVLPFDNLSGDPGQDYLADGITESIITQLSKLDELFVTARNSTFTYKGKPVKVQQVAEELGVRYVLEGSVQRSGENLRISAQLIDALSGNHVWAERYDQELGEIFALQDEITLNVLTALQVTLTAGEIARLNRRQTDNLEAYLQYYQGVTHSLRFTAQDNERARSFFERAAELDPGFVRPWVNQAWTHQLAARFGWSASRAESYKRAAEIAQKALSLDDANPGVHALLGAVYRSQRKFDEAIAAGRKAIALAPNISENHALLAVTLYYAGEFEETIALTKKAMRLHPHYPDWYLYRIGTAYRMLGRYDEAVAALKEFFDRNPTRNLLSITALAATYSMMGRMEEAGALVAQALELDPNASLERVAKMHYFRDPAHLQSILDALRKAGLPESPPLPLPEKPSIAVLPFTNLSGDPEQDYFADGMSEDLITDLSKISGLFVIARNSSFAYKGKSPDVRQVGRELGVRYLLEGSVRRAGAQVRINAQLIDATTGGHLWAERYDGTLDDVFALQDRVTKRVVQALELRLTETDRDRRGKGPRTGSPEAYDLVLQARKLMTRFDYKAATEARDLLQRAVEIDPAYTEAYSLLGFYYFDEWRVWGRKRDQNLSRALELATTAVELTPLDPAPHVLLALVYQWRRDFDAANTEADTALALQPNDAITLSNLGSMLSWAHRSEEAIGVLNEAVRLDPFHPPNYLERLASAYAGVGDYAQCVEVAKRGVALDPNYVSLHVELATCYAALGREEEARAAAADILRTNPRFTLKAFSSYVPFSDERDLQRKVKMLRQAGVPE